MEGAAFKAFEILLQRSSVRGLLVNFSWVIYVHIRIYLFRRDYPHQFHLPPPLLPPPPPHNHFLPLPPPHLHCLLPEHHQYLLNHFHLLHPNLLLITHLLMTHQISYFTTTTFVVLSLVYLNVLYLYLHLMNSYIHLQQFDYFSVDQGQVSVHLRQS